MIKTNPFVIALLRPRGLNWAIKRINNPEAPSITESQPRKNDPYQQVSSFEPKDIRYLAKASGIAHNLPEFRTSLKLFQTPTDEQQTNPVIPDVYMGVTGLSDFNSDDHSPFVQSIKSPHRRIFDHQRLFGKESISVDDIRGEDLSNQVYLIAGNTAQAIAHAEELQETEKIQDVYTSLHLNSEPNNRLSLLEVRHRRGTLEDTKINKTDLDLKESDGIIEKLKGHLTNLLFSENQTTSDEWKKINYITLLNDPNKFLELIINPLISVIKRGFQLRGRDDFGIKSSQFSSLLQFIDNLTKTGKTLDQNDSLLQGKGEAGFELIYKISDSPLAEKLRALINKVLLEPFKKFAESNSENANAIFLDQNSLISDYRIDNLRNTLSSILTGAKVVMKTNSEQSFYNNHNGLLSVALLHQKDKQKTQNLAA